MSWYSSFVGPNTVGHLPWHALEEGQRHVKFMHVSHPWFPLKVKEVAAAKDLLPGKLEAHGTEVEIQVKEAPAAKDLLPGKLEAHGTEVEIQVKEVPAAKDLLPAKPQAHGTEVEVKAHAVVVDVEQADIDEAKKVCFNHALSRDMALQALTADLSDRPSMRAFVMDAVLGNNAACVELLRAVGFTLKQHSDFISGPDTPDRLLALGFAAIGFRSPLKLRSDKTGDDAAASVARVICRNFSASLPHGVEGSGPAAISQLMQDFQTTTLEKRTACASQREGFLSAWMAKQLASGRQGPGGAPGSDSIAKQARAAFDAHVEVKTRGMLNKGNVLRDWLARVQPDAVPETFPKIRQAVQQVLDAGDLALASIIEPLFPRDGAPWPSTVVALGDSRHAWVAYALASDPELKTRLALEGLEPTQEGCATYVERRLQDSHSLALDTELLGRHLHMLLDMIEQAPLPEPTRSEPRGAGGATGRRGRTDKTNVLSDVGEWLPKLLGQAVFASPAWHFLKNTWDQRDEACLALLKYLANDQAPRFQGLGDAKSPAEILARALMADLGTNSPVDTMLRIAFTDMARSYPTACKTAAEEVAAQMNDAAFLDKHVGPPSQRQKLVEHWVGQRLQDVKALEDWGVELVRQTAQAVLPLADALTMEHAPWLVKSGLFKLDGWMDHVRPDKLPDGYPKLKAFITRLVETQDLALAHALEPFFPAPREKGFREPPPLEEIGDQPHSLLAHALLADRALRTRMALQGLTGSRNDCIVFVRQLVSQSTDPDMLANLGAFSDMAGTALYGLLNPHKGDKVAEHPHPWIDEALKHQKVSLTVVHLLKKVQTLDDAPFLALLRPLDPARRDDERVSLQGRETATETMALCLEVEHFHGLCASVADIVLENIASARPWGDEHLSCHVRQALEDPGWLDKFAGSATQRRNLVAKDLLHRLDGTKLTQYVEGTGWVKGVAEASAEAFDKMVATFVGFAMHMKVSRPWIDHVRPQAVPETSPNVRDFVARVIADQDAKLAHALAPLFPASGACNHIVLDACNDDPKQLLGHALAAHPAIRTRLALKGLDSTLDDCVAYVDELLATSASEDTSPSRFDGWAAVAGRTLHEQLEGTG